MDNQFSNMSGNASDDQKPETDIFKGNAEEQPSAGSLFSEELTGKEGAGEERSYTDPNSGYTGNPDAYQNFNQNGPSYGNGHYQQYGTNPNSGYQQGYDGIPNSSYQQGCNGNPNSGYQQGYSGNSNGSYQQSYGGNPNNNSYQSNYIGVPNAGFQQNYGNNPNSPYYGMDTSPLTMGDWLLTLLATMIPCAGIILMFVWAFSKTGNVNRRNFCRAQLIIGGVVVVLYLIVALIWGVSLAGALSTY